MERVCEEGWTGCVKKGGEGVKKGGEVGSVREEGGFINV